MKKIFLLFSFLIPAIALLQAQTICNPNGNIIVYSNYDGGVLVIDCDVNIPNLKIGVVSYEPVTISLTGAYVNNITEVRYAGYVSTTNNHCPNSPGTTTIVGAPGGAATSINFLPAATLSNPNGDNTIVCNYSCSTTTNQGGCNTPDQIVHYFQTTMGGSVRYHYTQYGCWAMTTYPVSSGGNCCAGTTACNITVDAGPNVGICPGNSVQLSCNSSSPNVTCQWTPSAGLSNANICNPIASPSVPTDYIVTCDSGGCSDSDTITVMVQPATPPVCQNVQSTYCENAAPVMLNFCTPAGGVYSGPGVSSNQFDPQAAGTGTHTLTYTYTNGSGCTGSSSFLFQVFANPTATLMIADSVCENDAPFTLTGLPSGGTFSGSGVSGNSFDPAAAGAGNHLITYVYSDSSGCADTATATIVVKPQPATPVLTVTGTTLSATAGADTYYWLLGGSPYDTTSTPSTTASQNGNYSVFAEVDGCRSDTSNVVTVILESISGSLNGQVIGLFPNPTSGSAILQFTHPLKVYGLEIYDMPGKRLIVDKISGRKERVEIDLSTLPDGNYLVKVSTEAGIFSGRIVKQ